MVNYGSDLKRLCQGRFFIDGTWVDAGQRAQFGLITPADESLFASVPMATAEDIEAAVSAARNAFDSGQWPKLSPQERAQYLFRLADSIDASTELFATVWAREVGGLVTHSFGMTAVSSGIVRDYAKLADSFEFVERHTPTAGGNFGYLMHEPVGVVGAIIPWNAPILMLVTKLAPALLAGCTAVVKTSPEAPLEGVLLGELIEAAGFPPGVINILMADREESELLVRHPGVDKISFTGSSTTGRRVASICGNNMTRATLELGGKSAAVVLSDANLDTVVSSVASQVSSLAMQFCSALSRVIVPRHLHDDLIERLEASLAGVRIGDPFDPTTEMGPLSTQRQLEKVEHYVAAGKSDGIPLITGGAKPAAFNHGYYFEPTLFARVPHDAKIAREEIFGPVICVVPAENDEEAIRLANDTPFGLNNSVFTQDVERGLAVARQLRSGTVGHNALRSDFGIAFGGYKQSGIGREGGRAGLMAYLEQKTVVFNEEPRALA